MPPLHFHSVFGRKRQGVPCIRSPRRVLYQPVCWGRLFCPWQSQGADANVMTLRKQKLKDENTKRKARSQNKMPKQIANARGRQDKKPNPNHGSRLVLSYRQARGRCGRPRAVLQSGQSLARSDFSKGLIQGGTDLQKVLLPTSFNPPQGASHPRALSHTKCRHVVDHPDEDGDLSQNCLHLSAWILACGGLPRHSHISPVLYESTLEANQRFPRVSLSRQKKTNSSFRFMASAALPAGNLHKHPQQSQRTRFAVCKQKQTN